MGWWLMCTAREEGEWWWEPLKLIILYQLFESSSALAVHLKCMKAYWLCLKVLEDIGLQHRLQQEKIAQLEKSQPKFIHGVHHE